MVLALILIVAKHRLNAKAIRENRRPPLPWYVTALLLVLLAALFYFRFTR